MDLFFFIADFFQEIFNFLSINHLSTQWYITFCVVFSFNFIGFSCIYLYRSNKNKKHLFIMSKAKRGKSGSATEVVCWEKELVHASFEEVYIYYYICILLLGCSLYFIILIKVVIIIFVSSLFLWKLFRKRELTHKKSKKS